MLKKNNMFVESAEDAVAQTQGGAMDNTYLASATSGALQRVSPASCLLGCELAGTPGDLSSETSPDA